MLEYLRTLTSISITLLSAKWASSLGEMSTAWTSPGGFSSVFSSSLHSAQVLLDYSGGIWSMCSSEYSSLHSSVYAAVYSGFYIQLYIILYFRYNLFCFKSNLENRTGGNQEHAGSVWIRRASAVGGISTRVFTDG